jgi:hypothetical protein
LICFHLPAFPFEKPAPSAIIAWNPPGWPYPSRNLKTQPRKEMTPATFTPDFARQLADLYSDMEKAYEEAALSLDFSCAGCPDNCCDSYFTHHTYIEWSYLWQGLAAMPTAALAACRQRAAAAEQESQLLLARGEKPRIMCPLNEQGLCIIYPYRLMICRLHGTPAALTLPDGRRLRFPGCFRCQKIVANRAETPHLDRTMLLQRLAHLERALLGARRPLLPKVKMTLAGMILHGPPQL